MSADNGIYVGCFPKTENLHNVKLHPVDCEYRVIHASAIDNLAYFTDAEQALKYEGENPREIFILYKDSEILTEEQAHSKAFEMEREILSDEYFPVLEYGISTLTFKHPFSYYQERSHEIVYPWDKDREVVK